MGVDARALALGRFVGKRRSNALDRVLYFVVESGDEPTPTCRLLGHRFAPRLAHGVARIPPRAEGGEHGEGENRANREREPGERHRKVDVPRFTEDAPYEGRHHADREGKRGESRGVGKWVFLHERSTFWAKR